MNSYREDSSLWVEKYRPQTINDCVLPERIKVPFRQYIESGHIPTLLLTGGPGIGKTTVARALANEIGADLMIINASADGNIDTIRTQMTQFASTVSMTGAKKITLLDEADGLSLSAQAGLRAFCETYSENHSIFFTCNYLNKISDALRSRSIVLDFKPTKEEKLAMLPIFFKRAINILDAENIEYDKKAVLELANSKFPDFRTCLNELQRYSMGGKIDSGILLNMTDETFAPLFASLKEKNFKAMRSWVAQHADGNSTHIFREVYDKASEKIEPKGLPALVLHLGLYSYRASMVVDQEINLAAFFTELMVDPNIVWK